MILAAVYLFVGFADTITHAEAGIATSISWVAASDSSDDDAGRPKKAPLTAEHCYICVPLTVPFPLFVSFPVSSEIKLTFPAPVTRFADYPALDTPPPKALT